MFGVLQLVMKSFVNETDQSVSLGGGKKTLCVVRDDEASVFG